MTGMCSVIVFSHNSSWSRSLLAFPFTCALMIAVFLVPRCSCASEGLGRANLLRSFTVTAENVAKNGPEWVEDSGDNVEWKSLGTGRNFSVPRRARARGKGRNRNRDIHSRDRQLFQVVGDGVGSMTYDHTPAWSVELNHDMRRRIQVQDVATIIVLVVVLLLTVAINASVIYHVSDDPSPVKFYSDPRCTRTTIFPRLTCCSSDAAGFLQVFNTQPFSARLRLVGKPSSSIVCDYVCGFPSHFIDTLLTICGGSDGQEVVGRRQRMSANCPSFDIALDLTPFLTGNGRLATTEDAEALENHLSSSDPLAVLLLQKDVEWDDWEDVATNVKQKLRSLGFPGAIRIYLEGVEETLVYRNTPWQNFVRNRLTQILVALSIVGWFFWMPYLRFRMRTVRIKSYFKIRIDPDRFWEHIEDGLDAHGGFRFGQM